MVLAYYKVTIYQSRVNFEKHTRMKIPRPILIVYICLTVSATELHSQASDESNDWLEWKYETSGMVYASPVLSGGVVYIGSMDSIFYALDAKSGREKWRFHSGNTIQSSAATYINLVIFGNGNKLFALTTGGKLKWSLRLCEDVINNQMDPWDFHHSSPCIHEGMVFIGTEKGMLLGLDAKSGEVVLRSQTLSEYTIRTTPVVSGDLVMYGDWDGVFYATHISNGTLAWKYDTKTDGTFPWVNAIHGTPLVSNGHVFFAGRSCRLYSLDIRTGKKKWHYSSPSDQWLLGGPEIADGIVYQGSSDQLLFHAIDAASGDLRWTADMDGRTWGSARVKGDRVYQGANSFYTIDAKSGEILQQYLFPKVHEEKKYGEYLDRTANFHSSPLLYDGMIILGSDDGHIYAIKEL